MNLEFIKKLVEGDEFKTVSVEVCNPQGLHARPAAKFVEIANKHKDCEVNVSCDGNTANGKSIMGVMTLVAGQGSTLEISAKGDDAKATLEELKELVEKGFYEI